MFSCERDSESLCFVCSDEHLTRVSADAEAAGRRDQWGGEAQLEEAAWWERFPQRGGESAPLWLAKEGTRLRDTVASTCCVKHTMFYCLCLFPKINLYKSLKSLILLLNKWILLFTGVFIKPRWWWSSLRFFLSLFHIYFSIILLEAETKIQLVNGDVRKNCLNELNKFDIFFHSFLFVISKIVTHLSTKIFTVNTRQ